jgi:hypothetical protein
MKLCGLLSVFVYFSGLSALAQYVPDMKNGDCKNPITFADYSDPDVIRVE